METAAEAVVRLDPRDDAGTETFDRYDWQAAMAAADGLRLCYDSLDGQGRLDSDEDARILCERHEDWAVLRGESAELVSAKHRESATGPWTTMRQLVGDGGLAHLFGRWTALERKPTLRLVTCAELAPGVPRKLAAAASRLRARENGAAPDVDADTEVEDSVGLVAQELMGHPKHLPDYWQVPAKSRPESVHLHDVREFLTALVIQDDRPARGFVHHAAPSMYVRPVLDRLGEPETFDRPVWEAVCQLFRARMRARGHVADGSLPSVLGLPASDPTTAQERERALAARIVTVADIATAVQTALAVPMGYQPLPTLIRPTRLSVKMDRGGCSPTSIERAEQLVLDFRSYWRSWAESAPGRSAGRPALNRALMKIADHASRDALPLSGPWGAAMWAGLDERMSNSTAFVDFDGLDPDLALGGVCDLASRCQVWFSPMFDVGAEISRLRGEREEGQ